MMQDKNNKKFNKTICLIWISIFLVVALLAEIVIVYVHKTPEEDVITVESTTIQEETTITIPATQIVASEPAETTPPATEPTIPPETQPVVKTILPKYASKYEENNEFFGWLRIEDTKIDFPVMHTPDDPEKYLHVTFDGFYKYAGTPFIDAKCSPDSDNLLIYGHNMKDGTMFHDLLRYEEQSYWEEHPVITFDTVYEEQEYEVLSAFYDRVYYQSETCYKFYKFIDAQDQADFDYNISQLKEKSLYDTGINAEYGDKLIMLITCSYQVENGRFVVVAVRKE